MSAGGSDWAAWAHEIQAIAQNGLEYASDPYDRDRYAQLQRVAGKMMTANTGVADADIVRLYADQSGYATPKAAVRGAAFRDGKLLLVREVADQHRWTLPGGWSDVALTPAENVAKEMREETGFDVAPRKLAAAFDRNRQGMLAEPFHVYILFFICEIVGGVATLSAA